MRIKNYTEAFLGLCVVGVVMMLLVPLTPGLLDLLLSISIVMAILTLLLTLYTEDALSFSSFPSLLLFVTVFRLALNIASTRMILADGHAGRIIQTFGAFVTEGNQVVGIVIFTLVTIVNFVVITKGSGRVAEVAARFTLDALPGKQSAIDSDLNSGLINEQEARARREKVAAEADFYGAMDGASKFVRGDAIAGIIITLVNIIGGFTIGMLMKGLSATESATTYTVLTIGDGLVTQIPALLVSVGAGILITRASAKQNLSKTLQTQLFNHPQALMLTAGILALLGLIPGMPLRVMLPLSLVLGIYAYKLPKKGPSSAAPELPSPLKKEDEFNKLLQIESFEIELGLGLLLLVDARQGGDLLERINKLRKQVAAELGLVIPPVQIRDSAALGSDLYIIKIRGIEVAKGAIFISSSQGSTERGKSGSKRSGLNEEGMAKAMRDEEDRSGEAAAGRTPDEFMKVAPKGAIHLTQKATIADALSLLTNHLNKIVHSHAHELLNRQEVQRLLEQAKPQANALIEELIPKKLSMGHLLKILQNLLQEGISIRDLPTILETLADYSDGGQDLEVLTEHVRSALSRNISKQYAGVDQRLHAITFDPRVEQLLNESIEKNKYGTRLVLRSSMQEKIFREIHLGAERAAERGVQPVLLTVPSIRPCLKRLIDRSFPHLPVLSINEVVSEVEIEPLHAIPNDVLMG